MPESRGRAASTAYRQGAFDCFCAVYAVVNAARHAVQPLMPVGRADGEALFFALVRHLDHAGVLCDVLTGGTPVPWLSRLLRACEAWTAEHWSVRLVHAKPFHCRASVGVAELAETIIAHVARPGHTAIVGLAGRRCHWTAVCGATESAWQLLDSEGVRRLRVRHVDTRPPADSGRPYCVAPTGVFLLRAAGPAARVAAPRAVAHSAPTHRH